LLLFYFHKKNSASVYHARRHTKMLYFDISMDNSLYEINKSMPEILKLLTYMPSSNKAHHVLTLINNLEKKTCYGLHEKSKNAFSPYIFESSVATTDCTLCGESPTFQNLFNLRI
jgi:hypothetical protein